MKRTAGGCIIAMMVTLVAVDLLFVSLRAEESLMDGMPVIGRIRAKGVGTHTSKMWMLGCECLDRDYAEFAKYRDYILPLGIGRIRLQAGWARCERERGKFDFGWLDEPVDWAVAHGVRPTLDLSYGNLLYKGGGQAGLAGEIPSGEEGLAAWDRWIETLVSHYRGKVDDYLMWNEPDTHRAKNDLRAVAEFNVRTARIIRRLSPESRIAALQLAQPTPENIRMYIKAMGEGWRLFDSVCWHRYGLNPDSRYADLERIAKVVSEIAPGLKIRHTEAGCISEWADFFAMKHYPWTEIRQAKWDMRRMIGDISRGIETSVFTLCDLRYRGKIDAMNRKGLLRANDAHDVIGIKKAYRAVQNVVSVFDAGLERGAGADLSTADRTVSLFGWRRGAAPLFVFWGHGPVSFDRGTKEFSLDHAAAPGDGSEKRPLVIDWSGTALKEPVWCDLLTGEVRVFPMERQIVHSCGVTFTYVPCYDSPCLVTERAAIDMEMRGTEQ